MTQSDIIDLKRLVLIIRRHIRLVGAIVSGFIVMAILYLSLTVPQYTAKTSLFLDRSLNKAVSDVASVQQMGFETAAIESEVEIIHSQRVIHAVITQLKDQNYFQDSTDPQEISSDILKRLTVRRVGETYVLSITYTSDDPQKSADIANAVAESYIAEKLTIISDMSIRTVSWLQSKINELRQQSIAAEEKITDYRTIYNKAKRGQGKEDEEVGLAELRTLEKEAETYNALYDFYLEKLETINLHNSFPLTEIRIISHAKPPTDQSHPQTIVILGLSLILGIGLGIVSALLKDSLDHTLRRAGQVTRELNLTFLGFFPHRKRVGKKMFKFKSHDEKTYNINMYAESVADPFSLHAEVIRTLLNTADQKIGINTKKAIGVLSIGRSESKSVIASNLALYTAQSTSTLLIDGNVRTSSAFLGESRSSNMHGFGDVFLGKNSLQKSCLYQESGSLTILPSLEKDADQILPHLNAGRVQSLIETCQKQYDFIVIDCPPLLTPADVYSFTESVDGFIVVAEWGKTLSNELNFYLKHNNIEQDKILGIVLENAHMQKMKKHYGHKV